MMMKLFHHKRKILGLILTVTSLSAFAEQLPALFINQQVYLEPQLTNGTKVRFFTDTGGGWNVISKELLEKYNWPIHKKKSGDGFTELTPMPSFKKGHSIPAGDQHNFMEGKLFIATQAKIARGANYQGFLGGRWHAGKILKYDYPKQTLSQISKNEVAQIKAIHTQPLGFQKNDQGAYTTAFPSIDLIIDGQTHPMLFDTGATVHLSKEAQHQLKVQGERAGTSYMAASVFDQWAKKHPDWLVIDKADILLDEPMIQVPKVTLGNITLGPVWFTRRQDKNFHEYMSKFMDRKIDGAIGGSLLQYLSFVIDYPKEQLHILEVRQ
ncbi:hypothetical protein [Pleionea sp. CnH1-48]|uniref:hypothetical protein n=1 Tax=Pleionea sp. CnH1-48 TaxID=2954494 RepID=UPI0020977FE7|nr:hypothetical protein [Pleionea sp. CnH1-48]MCO7226173.1 hypothetical protein [Pleionea sp. CnH1-48]